MNWSWIRFNLFLVIVIVIAMAIALDIIAQHTISTAPLLLGFALIRILREQAHQRSIVEIAQRIRYIGSWRWSTAKCRQIDAVQNLLMLVGRRMLSIDFVVHFIVHRRHLLIILRFQILQ